MFIDDKWNVLKVWILKYFTTEVASQKYSFLSFFFNDSPPLSHHNIYISAFFKGALQKYNSVDIMVNNAGIIHEKQWKKCVDINLVSSVSMTGQSFIHMMYDNT
jgi:hypothetical protein